MTQQKTPQYAKCSECNHEWILCYLPMETDKYIRFLKSPCQNCGSDKVNIKMAQQLPHELLDGSAKDTGDLKDRDKVIRWLFGDDTGLSSKSLAFEYLGKAAKDICAPRDPDDLGRCLRLIEIVPEIRTCVDSLGKKHSGWAKAAKIWDKISQSMRDEVGIHWEKARSAPITFDLMEEIRG